MTTPKPPSELVRSAMAAEFVRRYPDKEAGIIMFIEGAATVLDEALPLIMDAHLNCGEKLDKALLDRLYAFIQKWSGGDE